jgi:predicted MFS family arabinose efflux permease
MRNHAAGAAVLDQLTRAPGWVSGSWSSVAVLGLGAFAIGTELFVVAGILSGLAGDLGVTAGAAGLTVTVFALAYATGAVLLGALLGTRPQRQLLIGSLGLFGLFSMMSAVAPTLPALLAARALGGLAASVYLPAGARRPSPPCRRLTAAARWL